MEEGEILAIIIVQSWPLLILQKCETNKAWIKEHGKNKHDLHLHLNLNCLFAFSLIKTCS